MENTGPDFDPFNENRPRIALRSIQQRLEMICHGEMKIMPHEGAGTVVKVTIT